METVEALERGNGAGALTLIGDLSRKQQRDPAVPGAQRGTQGGPHVDALSAGIRAITSGAQLQQWQAFRGAQLAHQPVSLTTPSAKSWHLPVPPLPAV